MSPDDEICLCFHVTRRKLEKFVRLERPQRVSQMSSCGGAGTGCGWCIPILETIFRNEAAAIPTADEYAAARERFRETGTREDIVDAGDSAADDAD